MISVIPASQEDLQYSSRDQPQNIFNNGWISAINTWQTNGMEVRVENENKMCEDRYVAESRVGFELSYPR